MKVIDLLNKIANGEKVPKKIKYLIYEYTYNDNDEEYQRKQNGKIIGLGEDRRLDIVLCDEVEIIEEDKKIEYWDYDKDCTNEWNFKEIKEKLDEIIDRINNAN